jgi:hypothetical protein
MYMKSVCFSAFILHISGTDKYKIGVRYIIFRLVLLGKHFVHWFSVIWNLKEQKRREIFQAALYKVLDSIMYDFLIINVNIHLFLQNRCQS